MTFLEPPGRSFFLIDEPSFVSRCSKVFFGFGTRLLLLRSTVVEDSPLALTGFDDGTDGKVAWPWCRGTGCAIGAPKGSAGRGGGANWASGSGKEMR